MIKKRHLPFFLLSAAVNNELWVRTIENPINIVGIDLTNKCKLVITNDS